MLETKFFSDHFEMLMTSCLEISKMILGKFFQSLESLSVGTRRRRTPLSVSCPCIFFVRIWKILSGICLLSGLCPYFLFGICLVFVCLNSVRCPDSVRIIEKKLPVVCLSGRTRARQSSPDFHSPCPPTAPQVYFPR